MSDTDKSCIVSAEVEEYAPLTWSVNEIRAAIPKHLFERHLGRAFSYLARDLVVSASFWYLATWIDSPQLAHCAASYGVPAGALPFVRWPLWLAYWWFQGLAFTGIWVIGHECGHGAFSTYTWINDVVGYITHSALWTPYFSWRISHHRHHQHHASMEKDEVNGVDAPVALALALALARWRWRFPP